MTWEHEELRINNDPRVRLQCNREGHHVTLPALTPDFTLHQIAVSHLHISYILFTHPGKCNTLRSHLSILVPMPAKTLLNMKSARKERTMMMAKDTQYVLAV